MVISHFIFHNTKTSQRYYYLIFTRNTGFGGCTISKAGLEFKSHAFQMWALIFILCLNYTVLGNSQLELLFNKVL